MRYSVCYTFQTLPFVQCTDYLAQIYFFPPMEQWCWVQGVLVPVLFFLYLFSEIPGWQGDGKKLPLTDPAIRKVHPHFPFTVQVGEMETGSAFRCTP